MKKIIIVNNEIQAIEVRQTRASSSPSLLQGIIFLNYQKRLQTMLQVRDVLYHYHTDRYEEALDLHHKIKQLLGENFRCGYKVTSPTDPTESTTVPLEDLQFDYNQILY